MFGNLQIGKGWGQFTNIFVLDTALFCGLMSNSKHLVVMWEIGKHEFHGALYILCSFHQKNFFSDMAQCPSPWDGGCQTLNFCKVLAILCNFQQNFFSELG